MTELNIKELNITELKSPQLLSNNFNVVIGKINPGFSFDPKTFKPIGILEILFQKLLIGMKYSVSIKHDGELHAICLIDGELVYTTRRDYDPCPKIKKGKKGKVGIPDEVPPPPMDWISGPGPHPEGKQMFGTVPVSPDDPARIYSRNACINGKFQIFFQNSDGSRELREFTIDELGNYAGFLPETYHNKHPYVLTMESVGPSVQQNKERVNKNCLIIHGNFVIDNFPQLLQGDTPDSLIEKWAVFFSTHKIEGVILKFEDGECFKIRQDMFNLEWAGVSDDVNL
jgi:hypothetical protein